MPIFKAGGAATLDIVARVREALPGILSTWVALWCLRQQGRKEGEQKGERKILVKLLRLRFGELSEAAVARIRAAKPRQIERWAERVLTARSLDEVLGKP